MKGIEKIWQVWLIYELELFLREEEIQEKEITSAGLEGLVDTYHSTCFWWWFIIGSTSVG